MAGKLIIGIGLLAIIILAAFFPHAAWQLQRWFAGSGQNGASGVQSALTENQALKAELARLTPLAELLPEERRNGRRLAEVFSRYPFSVRNALIINAGEIDSVRSGEPVFLVDESGSSSVLVGIVREVRRDTATVQPLFDPGFKAAVRVGTNGADALLTGGPEPKLSLIAKDAAVQPGDVVVIASPEFPLGVSLATVGILEPAEDQTFKDATLVFGYDIGGIRVVQVGPYAQ